jgi:hypothetical protein
VKVKKELHFFFVSSTIFFPFEVFSTGFDEDQTNSWHLSFIRRLQEFSFCKVKQLFGLSHRYARE